MVAIISSRRWWALAALVLSVLVIGLDATILNVALPTLAVDLGASTGELQWIVDAYLIPFAALLLPAGVLGDRFGRKRLLLTGLAVFGAASLLAATAGGSAALIAARVLLGAGGALIMPLSVSILPSLFPPHERSKAIAAWSAGMALGLPLGPILGGYLLDRFHWGSIFLINLPVVAVALAAAAVLLPESRDERRPRFDLPGALLSVGGLAALVHGVIEAPSAGWTSPAVLVPLAAGVVLLTAFVMVEARSPAPMMDLRLFTDRVFLWGSAGATLVSLAMMGVLFVVPLHLQAVLGHDAFGTGIRVVPMVLGLMAGGLAGERLLGRLSLRVLLPAGLALLAGGLALGALTGASSGYGFIAVWLTVAGAGVGLAMVPAMDGVLAVLPQERVGAGSGTLQALRQVGGVFGVAGLGSLLSAGYADGLPGGAPEAARDSVAAAVRLGDPALAAAARESFTGGMSDVLLVCAALAAAGAAAVAVFMRADDARESAHELTSAP
ncbi:MFS transporter [Planomonospora sp. ID82291]|uniref:MFS transporter n=1 Tax=Planomonospora sp. ID82291 TaxID=2738136 RepID=UPI001A1C9565|nr:MFS transporter [Planomonospora sp. ID82291]MBG0815015.1 MFS transporter [Planomonospora sp. ID82291]